MPEKNKNTDQKKLKEAAIFEAACRVIKEKGYHQARMADIAAEAGISYGLVYHYYKSKSDLFDAILEEWWGPLDSISDQLLEMEMPVEKKLGAIADYFLDQYEQRPDLVHIFITEFSRSTANLTPERLMRFKRIMGRTEQIIQQGCKDGAIRPDLRPRHLTYFFLGAVEALITTMVFDNQPLKSREHKKRLNEAVLTMFFEGARP